MQNRDGCDGDGVFAINPFVYSPTLDPFSMDADAVIAYGFAPNIDIIALQVSTDSMQTSPHPL